jgi:hypothetical protein
MKLTSFEKNLLRNNQNWISELNILKKAIPKPWIETLITQDSIKTQVIPKKYVKIEKNLLMLAEKFRK